MPPLINHSLLEEVKSNTNNLLKEYFAQKINEAEDLDSNYAQLWREITNLSAAGGKRLRPYISVLGYKLYGGDSLDYILPVAASQELLHLCMLVHDDIIDRELIRYGVGNLTHRYLQIYERNIPNKEDRLHFANSASLIGGDLLLSGAYEVILKSSISDKDKLIAQNYLANSISQVAGGELLDTEASFTPYEHVDPTKIALLKTARYSFVFPFKTGAAIAGANASELDNIQKFAESLGIAYQLRDDIIGIFGNEHETGKSNKGDLAEGKRTYLILKALELADNSQLTTLNQYIGKQDIANSEADTIRQIIIDTGSLDATEQLISNYAASAETLINTITKNQSYENELQYLIQLTTQRSR